MLIRQSKSINQVQVVHIFQSAACLHTRLHGEIWVFCSIMCPASTLANAESLLVLNTNFPQQFIVMKYEDLFSP